MSLCYIKKFCTTFIKAIPYLKEEIFWNCFQVVIGYSLIESKLSFCECLGCSNTLSTLVLKRTTTSKSFTSFFSEVTPNSHGHDDSKITNMCPKLRHNEHLLS